MKVMVVLSDELDDRSLRRALCPHAESVAAAELIVAVASSGVATLVKGRDTVDLDVVIG